MAYDFFEDEGIYYAWDGKNRKVKIVQFVDPKPEEEYNSYAAVTSHLIEKVERRNRELYGDNYVPPYEVEVIGA